MTVIAEKNVITKFVSDTSGLEQGAKKAESVTRGVEKAATDASKASKQLSEEAKKAVNEVGGLGGVLQRLFGDAAAGFVRAAQSVASFTKSVILASRAFGVLRAAIIGTGIGALVVALGSVIAYFASTQRGIDAVNRVMTQLRTISASTLGVLQDVGRSIVTAFENPGQALRDFGDLILTNVVNRFKAVGEIVRGLIDLDFKRAGDGLAQAATGVENAGSRAVDFLSKAAKAGREIAALTVTIEKLEAARSVTIDKIEEGMEEQLLIARDTAKSDKERKKAIDEVLRMSEEVARVDLQINGLKQTRLRLEQSLNDTGREGNKELNALISEQDAIQDSIQQKRLSFIRILGGIQKRAQVDELLGLDKLNAELDKATKKLNQLEPGTKAFYDQAEAVKDLTAEVKAWEKAIEDATKRTDNLVETLPGTGLINTALAQADKAIKDIEGALITAIVQGDPQAEAKLREQLEFVKLQVLKLKAELGDEAAFSELLGTPADKFRIQLPPASLKLETDDNNEKEVQKFEDHVERIKDGVSQLFDSLSELYEIQAQQAENAINIQESRVERFAELAETGSARQLIIEEERLQKLQDMRDKAVEKQRKIAQAQMLINQAQTISSSIAAIAEGFSTGGPAGIALGVATAAALALSIAGMIATAKSSFSSVPAFAEGTDYFNGKGTGKSDSNLARISRGERIVPAETNAAIMSIAGSFPNARLPEAVRAYMGTPVIFSALVGLNSTMESGLGEIRQELSALREENRKTRINFMATREGISAMVSQYEADRAWIRG